jgi:hypothetical protein
MGIGALITREGDLAECDFGLTASGMGPSIGRDAQDRAASPDHLGPARD